MSRKLYVLHELITQDKGNKMAKRCESKDYLKTTAGRAMRMERKTNIEMLLKIWFLQAILRTFRLKHVCSSCALHT